MSTSLLSGPPLVPASLHLRLKCQTNLAAFTEELASLRYSILMLTRWEATRDLDCEGLAHLRSEVAELRALFFETIDQIAMCFGVQQAMDAQQEVERTVTASKGPMPAKKVREQLYF
jgi:hypothetical protein